MPTPEIFSSQPPFPEDIPTCSFSRLSYEKLLAGDLAESNKLFQACIDTGFFMLDLRGTPEGEDFIDDAKGVLELDREVSALGKSEKSKYRTKPPLFIFGWKSLGGTKIENGSPDRCEFYSVSQDSVLGTSGLEAHPLLVERSTTLLKSFVHHGYNASTLILCHLDAHLGLRHGTLASLHPTSKPSMTTVRLIHIPPQSAKAQQTSLFGHTDNGSITILFNVIGGLQILPPGLANEEHNWRWVRPEPGCAIVNLGDCLVQWSGGILRSNMHRVLYAPGQQAECERYSFAYVLKPDNEASMRRLVGPDADEDDQYNYNDWLMIKGAASREGKNLVRISSNAKPDIRRRECLVSKQGAYGLKDFI